MPRDTSEVLIGKVRFALEGILALKYLSDQTAVTLQLPRANVLSTLCPLLQESPIRITLALQELIEQRYIGLAQKDTTTIVFNVPNSWRAEPQDIAALNRTIGRLRSQVTGNKSLAEKNIELTSANEKLTGLLEALRTQLRSQQNQPITPAQHDMAIRFGIEL